MESVTLLVNLTGLNATTEQAEGDRHFHFIGHWPAGEKRFLWYPSRAFGGLAANESVDVIGKVEVAVYADQLITVASREIAGERYDNYVKSWAEENLPGEKFSGRWYSANENLFDPAGFEVTYNGSVSSFVVKRVTVEAVNGSRKERVFDKDPAWNSSGKKWICHEDFNTLSPRKISVIISFPGTSYEHVVTWNR